VVDPTLQVRASTVIGGTRQAALGVTPRGRLGFTAGMRVRGAGPPRRPVSASSRADALFPGSPCAPSRGAGATGWRGSSPASCRASRPELSAGSGCRARSAGLRRRTPSDGPERL